MRKSNLLKKGIAVLLAFALVGLFASCKKDAEDSKYKAVYCGFTLADEGEKADVDKLIEMFALESGTDYTLNGTTLTFTDAGFAKYLSKMGGSYVTYVAFVIYNGELIMPVTQEDIDKFLDAGLSEGTDFTYAGNKQLIILTDAGYAKGEQVFGDDDED